MPIEIVAGAGLGLILDLLHEAIEKAKDRSFTTRCILDRLNATISNITPFIIKINTLEVDESQRKIIEELRILLVKVISIVEAYAELKHRNILRKYRYKKRIKELEGSSKWMVDVDVQVNQWLDIKELMRKMSVTNIKLDEITSHPVDSCCRSSEEEKCSKPKFDLHLRWKNPSNEHEHEIRFVYK